MSMPWVLRVEGGDRAADRAEVRRALEVLIDPSRTFELRGLPSARSVICRGSDLDAAVEAAWSLSDGAGVYWTLNPCRPDLEHAAANRDILSRRWFPIDCDPVKPADVSATDEEKGEAIGIACDVAEYLSSLGWPEGVWIDSGNGGWLLYPIDLPAGDLAQQVIKEALVALANRFDSDKARVDWSIHNAARIARLPGTWNRKGPDDPDRPHRMARLIRAPGPTDGDEKVTAEMLGAVASRRHGAGGGGKGDADRPDKNPWKGRTSKGRANVEKYVKSAIGRECDRVEATPVGGRNNALNVAAFNLGTMAEWEEMAVEDARGSLLLSAHRVGLGDAESRKTIESGWTAGSGRPRERPKAPGDDRRRNGAPPPQIGPVSNGRIIVLASEIVPRKVEWLWPDRIPIGKLTTFAGWGGLGKSFVTMDLAARISNGDEIPGMAGECFGRGNVLILNTEDDPDDTSVPRLIEARADLERIAFAKSEILGRFTLADLDTLDAMLDQLGGARLLVIDPATAHLGDANDHKNAELRALLMPLSLWAMERRLAVVLVTHVNKPQAGKVEAMARVVGSVAWVNAVRAAVMFSKDPDDKTRRLFIPFKSNNAPEKKGLAYRLASTDALARVEWLGEVDTSADDAVNHVEKKKVGEGAVGWITDRFRERREWSSKELKKLAIEAGVSTDALFKGKEVKVLPITKRPINGAWVWFAEAGWPPERSSESPESSESSTASPFHERIDELSDQLSDEPPNVMQGESQLSELSGLSGLSHGESSPESPPNLGDRPPGWRREDAWIHYDGKEKS